MADTLKGKKVAILAADMFERVELEKPRKALEDAGAKTEIVSIHDGKIKAFDHFDPAKEIEVDRTVEEASADDYDALLVPGGVGNPDQLRGDENAVAFVRAFHDSGKPMAVICHGPWVLVEAGIVRGRRLTSLADAPDRHPQRRRRVGRRRGRHRRRPRHEPEAGRHPGLRQEDAPGVRRREARASAGRRRAPREHLSPARSRPSRPAARSSIVSLMLLPRDLRRSLGRDE
jgi:PfpI family intracellular protease